MTSCAPKEWLSLHAMPLWLERGVDRVLGGFHENLSMEGEVLLSSRRCMVQARQIFAFRTAIDLAVCDKAEALAAVERGIAFLLSRYSLPSGAFRHSVTEVGDPDSDVPDLYAQSFALFALASGYRLLGEPAIKERAKALVDYLRRERRAAGGGFTELESGTEVFRSNPHMHLFEAAIAWMEVDRDPLWRDLADELLGLCLGKFLDAETGALAERFLPGWAIERIDGRFIYEPGHLCEWSWLMGRYQRLVSRSLADLRFRLFELAERTGLDPVRAALCDQLWSDRSTKAGTARFWPQCERIKAAAQLGRRGAAVEAMSTLFRYLDCPLPGLWFDTMEESGELRSQPVKASSLYHIIGAISEYEGLE